MLALEMVLIKLGIDFCWLWEEHFSVAKIVR